ncbi:MAG TPA: alcohol dehydrogenase catalytic domain-containing protein [Actinomycetota bacterium]|nr:alcohol dehydrogenase catalytic domain-containing protein [Actinomycetota bacterium]
MTVQAVELFRSVPRYLTARAIGGRAPGLVSGPLAPLRLANKKDPEPPGPGWARVRPLLSGICGSDLATISGRSSFYFSPLVSMPFVPGHEVVGELLDEVEGFAAGTRVVLEPVLKCEARGLEPCDNCAAGLSGRCDRVTTGHLSAGLQTGYCKDTGGGWSRMFLAHRSQLHPVPDELSDRRAVLVEPLSCAVHGALRADVRPNDEVVVIGAGTVGILTLIALKELTQAGRVTVVAKHGKQRGWAGSFGATEVVPPSEATNAVRRSTRAMKLKPEMGRSYLMGGADVVFDCVGSRSSLDLALRTTRAGGRIVLSGIPVQSPDLTPLWFRELELVGAYTGGMETVNGDRRHSFDLAIDLARENPIDGIVGATYPLSRWREAIDHALGAGKLGTLKVAFDPRAEGI